jgi:hypothetical protein
MVRSYPVLSHSIFLVNFASDTHVLELGRHSLHSQGKTQIALGYCRRVKGKRGVFWVDATSEATVKRSFVTISTKIQATEDIMDVLGDSLDPWLMVFDNYDDADDFDNIRDYMPEGEEGCILITSRHAASINFVVDPDYAIEGEDFWSTKL